MNEQEKEQLETTAKAYLELMRLGKFERARALAQNLVYSTYTLDTVWMNAQKKVGAR